MKEQKKGKCKIPNSKGSAQSSGVTLIALIITIIILLILAMTSVALIMRWNIVEKTEYAAEGYQSASEKESIDLAYEEWKLNDDENANLTVDGAEVSNNTEGRGGWTVKFKNSGNKYTVDENGNIKGPTTGDDTNENGLLGDQGQETDSKLPKFEDIDKSKTLEWDGDGDGETEEWLVIEKTDISAEIISKNVMGSLTLGKECKWTIDGGEQSLNWDEDQIKNDADVNSDGSLSELEKAVYSYNHGVEIINRYCKDLIKNAPRDSVKSLGVDEESDIEGMYTSENLQKWLSNYTGKVRCANDVYSEPWTSKMTEEQKKSDKSYWFASRFVEDSTTDSRFYIRSVSENALLLAGNDLWYFSLGGYYCHTSTRGVRPVVSINYPESYN